CGPVDHPFIVHIREARTPIDSRVRRLARRIAGGDDEPNRTDAPNGGPCQMVTAADYPFLDVLGTMLIFFAWVIWFWLLIRVFGDHAGRIRIAQREVAHLAKLRPL